MVGLSAVGYQCTILLGHAGRCWERPCSLTEPADSMSFYREFRQKVNITFNNNDTVSFVENRSLHFQPDKSQGSESDYIVLPNIMVLVRLWPCATSLMLTLLLPGLAFRGQRARAPSAPLSPW